MGVKRPRGLLLHGPPGWVPCCLSDSCSLHPSLHPTGSSVDPTAEQPRRDGCLICRSCGKTALANAIANQYGVAFLSISAPEVVAGVSGGPQLPALGPRFITLNALPGIKHALLLEFLSSSTLCHAPLQVNRSRRSESCSRKHLNARLASSSLVRTSCS